MSTGSYGTMAGGNFAAGTLLGGGFSPTMFGVQMRNAAAQKQAEAMQQAAQAAVDELTRQQIEGERIASEQKSDTIRRANRALGSIRAMAAENGASGTTSLTRIIVDMAANEGRDLGRIENNRVARAQVLQSKKIAVKTENADALSILAANTTSSNVSSIMGSAKQGIATAFSFGAFKGLTAASSAASSEQPTGNSASGGSSFA